MHDADSQLCTSLPDSQVELMRHAVTAHRQAKLNVDASLRVRNKQLVTLRLRLEQQKRRPGSLDLETDPAVEAAADRICRDEQVRLLTRENAELATLVGQLQARTEDCACHGDQI